MKHFLYLYHVIQQRLMMSPPQVLKHYSMTIKSYNRIKDFNKNIGYGDTDNEASHEKDWSPRKEIVRENNVHDKILVAEYH